MDSKEPSLDPEEIALPTPEAARDEHAGADRVGQVIDGRYQLLEVIGRGGMGTVYKAEHAAIRRVVALKLLHAPLAQVPEVSRRFEREAFAIGRIEHPNCVNVSDFGRLPDGSLYLVMEYLDGRALSDELAEKGRLPPARTLRILRHVLRGLGHAHANEIVHRDVKPENVVMIEHEGDPDFAKILDFGIAKLVGRAAQAGGNDRLTQAGMAFGTPIYMSPEQALGQPIDGRADLYAATVMAFEMIAGEPPFQSEDKIEVMSMHASKPGPRLVDVAPDVQVPELLEQLLRRGLAKRPGDRFPDADAYIAAVDQILAELSPESIAVPPPAAIATATGMQPVAAQPLPTGPQQPFTPGQPLPTGAQPPFTPGPQPFATGQPLPTGAQPLPTGAQPLPTGAQPLPTGAQPHTTGAQPVTTGAQPHTTGAQPLAAQTHLPHPSAVLDMPATPGPLAARRRRTVLVAVGVLVSLGLLVALISGDPAAPRQPAAAAAPPDAGAVAPRAPEATLADQAAALLGKGAVKEAIELLQQHPDETAGDPAAQLQLGHAHAALRANAEALAAYQRALELDASLTEDTKLRTNLRLMMDDRGAVVSVDAAALVFAKLGDDQAAKYLVEWASGARQAQIRHQAAKAAEALGLGEQVDWAQSLMMDLWQEKRCQARRKVVARLRALGDARAIPELQKARRRSRNACLRKDAGEAIKYLESVTGDAGPEG